MASAAAPLVVDTDVLIDYLRGWEQAVDFLERCEQPLAISVITIAELLLSPVGLSISTKLAPQAFRTQMIALLFLASALGTAMSGQLAQFYNATDPVNNNINYFLWLGLIAIALGIVLFLIQKWILKLMEGVR